MLVGTFDQTGVGMTTASVQPAVSDQQEQISSERTCLAADGRARGISFRLHAYLLQEASSISRPSAALRALERS